jgi:hypothetical protein
MYKYNDLNIRDDKRMHIIIAMECLRFLCGSHMLLFYFTSKHNQNWSWFIDLIVRNPTIQSDYKSDVWFNKYGDMNICSDKRDAHE